MKAKRPKLGSKAWLRNLRKAGKARSAQMSPDERIALARSAGLARMNALTPEQRSELARHAGRLGGRPKSPKEPKPMVVMTEAQRLARARAGGLARMRALTPEQRSELGRLAAQAKKAAA